MITVKSVMTISTMLFTFTIAKLLGAEYSGVVFQAIAILTILISLSSFGLNRVTIRRIPRQLNEGKLSELSGQLMYTLSIVLVFALVAALAAQLILQFFGHAEIYAELKISVFQSIFLAVPFMTLSLMIGSVLKAIGKPATGAVLGNGFGYMLSTLFALGLYYAELLSVQTIAISFLLAMLLNMLLAFGLWKTSFSRLNLKTLVQPAKSTEILMLGRTFFVTTTMLTILTATDVVLLGALIDDAASGKYAVAVKFAALINFVVIALNPIFSVLFTVNFNKGDIPAIEKTAHKVSILGGIMGLMLVLFYFLLKDKILLFYGPEFVEAGKSLVILSVCHLVVIMLGPAQVLLNMSDKELVARRITIISVVFNAIINPIFIILLGLEGAAIATGLSLILNKLLSVLAVKKYMDFYTVPFLGKITRSVAS